MDRDDIGALKDGKLADIIVVKGDPLDDISVLENRDRLKLIMKQGSIYTNTMGA